MGLLRIKACKLIDHKDLKIIFICLDWLYNSWLQQNLSYRSYDSAFWQSALPNELALLHQ